MAQKRKAPVSPIYAVGVLWLAWAAVLPLYHLWHYLAAAAASFLVYTIVRGIAEGRGKEAAAQPAKEEPTKVESAKPASSGNPEVDKLRAEGARALGEMRRLNDSIKDEKISRQIDHLEQVTGKIIDHVAQHPEKMPQIRKFMNYYLPTTLKILNAYDRMGDTGISGENIDGTMGKIEGMMDTVTRAFDRQMDALFGTEAMDISADIKVMEQMLAQEGLAGPDGDTEDGGGITLQI